MRIYDPCYAATAVLSESFEGDPPKMPERWLRIYRKTAEGYDEAAALSGDERRAYPCVLLANQFICTAFYRKTHRRYLRSTGK